MDELALRAAVHQAMKSGSDLDASKVQEILDVRAMQWRQPFLERIARLKCRAVSASEQS